MLPVTIKLKHVDNKDNYNLELVSLIKKDINLNIDYVKRYKKDKLIVLHISSKNPDNTVETSVYVSREISNGVVTVIKVFTKVFQTDDYYLVHKVCKDLSTLAITVIPKLTSNIRHINNNRVYIVRYLNNVWMYCGELSLSKQVKYSGRYRLSHIMSFDHKGDNFGIILTPKDNKLRVSKIGCGVIFKRIGVRYIYNGYVKYKATSSKGDSTILDIRSKPNNTLEIFLVGNNNKYKLISV